MARDIEIDIERLGFLGDGIARHEDRDVLVPYALPGERWRIRLLGRDRGHLRGRPLRRMEGPARPDPPCPHFGRCGGCALQHLDPPDYARIKRERIAGALAARGLQAAEIELSRIEPTAESPPGSRRRVRLAVGRRGELGFRGRWSREIVDVERCIIASPALIAPLGPLREELPRLPALSHGAELALTDTDAGVDLLITARARPALDEIERLSRLAGKLDLAPDRLAARAW